MRSTNASTSRTNWSAPTAGPAATAERTSEGRLPCGITFTGSHVDKTSIRERLETYGDAVARQDLEAYLACWTEDGRRTGAGGECRGTAELRAHWGGVFGAIEQMAFFTQISAIEVDDQFATVRSSCLEVLKFRDGNSTQLVGDYADELVNVGGAWLFAHRHYQVAMNF